MNPKIETIGKTEIKNKYPVLFILLFALISSTALLVFTVPFRMEYLYVFLFSYFLRMFGVTSGYHRYFSHNAYKTSRIFQFILAWIGSMAQQKGVLWWSAHHRDHHRYSDTEKDIHSPKKGFWHSHMLWFLKSDYNEYDPHKVKDLTKFPELVWLDRYHWIAPLSYAVALYLVGGWGYLVYGYGLATFILGHATWTINSLSHLYGKQRFETGDTSRNNFWLALLTMGEGWHNNHHYYRHTANQGFFWYEIDLSYYILRLLSVFHIVWDLKKPPQNVMDLAREGNRTGRIVGGKPELQGKTGEKPVKTVVPV